MLTNTLINWSNYHVLIYLNQMVVISGMALLKHWIVANYPNKTVSQSTGEQYMHMRILYIAIVNVSRLSTCIAIIIFGSHVFDIM